MDACTCDVPDDERVDFGCPIHVQCDGQCKALLEPVTPEQIEAAYKHWRTHRWLHGCSHGN